MLLCCSWFLLFFHVIGIIICLVAGVFVACLYVVEVYDLNFVPLGYRVFADIGYPARYCNENLLHGFPLSALMSVSACTMVKLRSLSVIESPYASMSPYTSPILKLTV